MTRQAFEAFITAPPFEMGISRFDDRGAWPGSYLSYDVDLAWAAWKEATAAALERAAEEIKKLDKRHWFSKQSDFAEFLVDAIRALKDADTC